MSSQWPVVPGISVNQNGQAIIEASMQEVLFDLALKLEEVTNLPIDVQHVVAALVLGQRSGDIVATQIIRASDEALVGTLAVHVMAVFAQFGHELGSED